tara:strand:- start:2214 stop:2690 length:477 start_codon:yes stop_codon:yes gene_type:complete
MGKLAYIYISIALFVGSIYVSLANNNKYVKTLNEKEMEMRKKVVKERSNIYIIANLSAFLLVTLLMFNNITIKNRKNNAWMYTAIYFLTEYFVYMLLPKKHWMLHSVENKQDAIDWLNKYRMMSRNYHIGMLLGILAVGIFTYNYTDNNNIECDIYVM